MPGRGAALKVGYLADTLGLVDLTLQPAPALSG